MKILLKNKILIPTLVKLLIFIPYMFFSFTLIPKYMNYFGIGGNDLIGFLFLVILFVFIASVLLFFCLKNTQKIKYWICVIVSIMAFIISALLSITVLFSATIQHLFKGTDFWHCVFQYDAFNDIEPTETAFSLFMSLCYYLLFILFWIILKKDKK